MSAGKMSQLVFIFLQIATAYVTGGTISGALTKGICLCINEPNVVARSDPSNPSTKVATLNTGECFLSNGGIYHSNGDTWYELKDSTNGQRAWVDSFYLAIYLMDTCSNSTHVTKQSFHTPDGQASDCTAYGKTYTHGQHFQLHGLECTCDDGAMACSFNGKNCFLNNIVYPDGTAFADSTSGNCLCKQGSISCDGNIQAGVGK